VAPTQPDWSHWTVILLKPDCLARNLNGPVLGMVGQHVRVTAQHTLYPTIEQVFTHYADILPLSAELGVDVAAELRRIYLGHPVTVALAMAPTPPSGCALCSAPPIRPRQTRPRSAAGSAPTPCAKPGRMAG
jgi:hypothetical protein